MCYTGLRTMEVVCFESPYNNINQIEPRASIDIITSTLDPATTEIILHEKKNYVSNLDNIIYRQQIYTFHTTFYPLDFVLSVPELLAYPQADNLHCLPEKYAMFYSVRYDSLDSLLLACWHLQNSNVITQYNNDESSSSFLTNLDSQKLNMVNSYDNTNLLIIAATYGSVNCLKYLLSNGVDPNMCDIYGMTPLMYATMMRQYESINILLEYKACIDCVNINKYTVFSISCLMSFNDLARFFSPSKKRGYYRILLHKGVFGESILQLVILSGNRDLFSHLIINYSGHYDMFSRDYYNNDHFDYIFHIARYDIIERLIVYNPSYIYSNNVALKRIIMYALNIGNNNIIYALGRQFKKRVLNILLYDSLTIMEVIVNNGLDELFSYFINDNKLLQHLGANNITSLIHTIINTNNVEYLTRFMNLYDINTINPTLSKYCVRRCRYTPLMFAIEKKRAKIIELLLSKNVVLDTPIYGSYNENTFMQFALSNFDSTCFNLLLAANMDIPKLYRNYTYVYLDILMRLGYTAALALIENNRAKNINMQILTCDYKQKFMLYAAFDNIETLYTTSNLVGDINFRYGNKYWTALMFAAYCGQYTNVKFLLDKGANPNIVVSSGDMSALKLSILGGHNDCTLLLEQHLNTYDIINNFPGRHGVESTKSTINDECPTNNCDNDVAITNNTNNHMESMDNSLSHVYAGIESPSSDDSFTEYFEEGVEPHHKNNNYLLIKL